MNFQELKLAIYEQGFSEVAELDHDQKALPLKLVFSEGGRGEGERLTAILKYTNPSTGEELYAKLTGHYTSYNGKSWDRKITQVQPVTKTITVFDPIN
jgi:hypothetical protein